MVFTPMGMVVIKCDMTEACHVLWEPQGEDVT